MVNEEPERTSRWTGAVAGVAAALTAVGVGELTAALLGVVGPLVAVGNRVIAYTPGDVSKAAIELFGTYDKIALIAGTAIILVIVLAAAGTASIARWWIGASAIVVFAVLGSIAALRNVGASALAVLPVVVGGIVALAVFAFLLARAHGVGPRRLREGLTGDTALAAAASPDRRRFVLTSGAVILGAAGVGIAGRYLQGVISTGTGRAGATLPEAARMLDPIPPGASFAIEGQPPFLSTNDIFYRVDTALAVPDIDVGSWRLRIHGMVDQEVSLSFDDIARMDLVDIPITLMCVSNEIGGDLVDTARWRGVYLRDLLGRAGIQDGATQIVGRSTDGYTCGFPVEAIDERPAMLAIGFNGEPLAPERGFPARLVVSGLYGYVSATKWLEEIELTTFDAFDQYWVPRGYAERAPVHLMSRINVPSSLGEVPSGRPVTIAGDAWDQNVGIASVEVRIDDGEWQEAQLADPVNIHTWRQWKLETTLEGTGRHDITCRAINRAGAVQTEERTDPKPNGATGWHTVTAIVR